MKELLSRVWPEIKPLKFKLLIALVAGAIMSVATSFISILMEKLVVAWRTVDYEKAWQIPVALVLVWIVIGASRYINMFWIQYISEITSMGLCRKLMNKYLRLNVCYRQRLQKDSGSLMSRLISDVQTITSNLKRINGIFVQSLIVIFSFIIIVTIDLQFLFIFLLFLPMGILIKGCNKSLRKYGHENRKAMERLTSCLKESLDGSQVIQSFCLESQMQSKFDDDAEDVLKTRKSVLKREEMIKPILEIYVTMVIAFLMYIFGQKIFNGTIAISEIMKFVVATGLFINGLRRIKDNYVLLQQAIVVIKRMGEIFNATIEEVSSKNLKFPGQWKSIEYRNVSFSLNKTDILKNINIKIYREQMVAVVGPSGGGKTSLVNLFERFYEPDSGQILIDDIPISDIQLKEWRKSISLVSQDIFLFACSIEENILYGDLEKNEDVTSSAKLANAHGFISRLKSGYRSYIGEKGQRLSGGERQRISIARAFYKDAPILVLDEATNALDSKSELDVQKGLDKLMKNRTSLVISHKFSTIVHADKIFFIKNGQVSEQGTHKDLMACRGEYFQSFRLQEIRNS